MQIALNEAKLNEEKVKSELQHVQEENARLKKSKEQVSSDQTLFPFWLKYQGFIPSFLECIFAVSEFS